MGISGLECVPGDATGDARYYAADGHLGAVLEAGVLTFTCDACMNGSEVCYNYTSYVNYPPSAKLPVLSKEPFYAGLFKKRKRDRPH